MKKKMTIRVVAALAENLESIAKSRRMSVNSLITEIAWDFVEDWKNRYGNMLEKQKKY